VLIRNHPQGRALWDQTQGIQRLTRDVVVTQEGEDFILYCQELTHNQRTNEAVARGNLRVETRDSTITATVLRADFDAKMMYLSGNVVMKSHGDKDGIQVGGQKNNTGDGRNLRQEVLHKASSLTCDRVDYSYENREARLAGNIRLRQDKSFGTCEQILFDEENNVAQLLGKVEFTNAQGQTIRTRNLTIWIDANTIETKNMTTVEIPANKNNKPAGPPAPKTTFAPPPVLPNDLRQEFGRKPAPLAPLVPAEDTPPVVAAPTAAARTADTPASPAPTGAIAAAPPATGTAESNAASSEEASRQDEAAE
jgi:lipopolysaccharide assembly outer membrane protein LptD (OstA)